MTNTMIRPHSIDSSEMEQAAEALAAQSAMLRRRQAAQIQALMSQAVGRPIAWFVGIVAVVLAILSLLSYRSTDLADPAGTGNILAIGAAISALAFVRGCWLRRRLAAVEAADSHGYAASAETAPDVTEASIEIPSPFEFRSHAWRADPYDDDMCINPASGRIMPFGPSGFDTAGNFYGSNFND
ncbi:MAG: hypothetical protein JO142_16330 [Burkholderiales bacterium]|nr:hypothetical protein [Burkholderiales bacterium]